MGGGEGGIDMAGGGGVGMCAYGPGAGLLVAMAVELLIRKSQLSAKQND